MSEEENVKYWIPSNQTKFYEDVKEMSGNKPFYPVALPVRIFKSADDHGKYFPTGIPFFNWLRNNTQFSDGRIWIGNSTHSILNFENPTVAHNFAHWVGTTWKEKYGIKRYNEWGYPIFRSKDELMDELTNKGEIKIEAKVPFPIAQYDSYSTIDDKTFDVWCWFENTLSERVFRWNNTFYFESNKDAIAFKLTWCGNV